MRLASLAAFGRFFGLDAFALLLRPVVLALFTVVLVRVFDFLDAGICSCYLPDATEYSLFEPLLKSLTKIRAPVNCRAPPINSPTLLSASKDF